MILGGLTKVQVTAHGWSFRHPRLRLDLPRSADDEWDRNRDALRELLGLDEEAVADFAELPDSEHEVDLSVSIRPETPTS